MKRKLQNLFAGSLILICSITYAQPTITATGITPILTESYTTENTAYFNPGSGGANLTWNFSTLAGVNTTATSWVTVSSTPNHLSFANATIASKNTTGSNTSYNFFKTSASSIQNFGTDTGGAPDTIISNPTNPEDVLHFPFTYLDTYTDTWLGSYVYGAYTHTLTGTVVVTADAWGTLTTPIGTYPNCLRIHLVENFKDSSTIAGVTNYSNDEYLWYKDGAHAPLAFAKNYTPIGSAVGVATGGYLITTLGVNEIDNSLSMLNVYPNPATDKIKFDFTLSSNKKVGIKIFNVLGEQIQNTQNENGVIGINSIQMDVATLPEGIYFAQIVLDGNIAETKRFVVSK